MILELTKKDLEGDYTNNIDCPVCRSFRRKMKLPKGKVFVNPYTLYVLKKSISDVQDFKDSNIKTTYSSPFGGHTHSEAVFDKSKGKRVYVNLTQIKQLK